MKEVMSKYVGTKESSMKNDSIKMLLFVLVVSWTFTGCGTTAKEGTNTGQAMTSMEQLDYKTALTQLEAAKKAGENEELVNRALGIAHMGLADYESAIPCFEQALSQSNGRAGTLEIDTSYYLATAEYKMGNVDDAIETYSAIIGLRPKDRDAYYLRGSLRLEKQLYDDAVRDFNQAIDLDKNNPDIYVKIYETMENKGYKAQGHDYLDQAMKLDTKITDFQKGKLYYCLEDYEQARDLLEKARGTGEEGVVLYLGKTYEALGDMNYAASLYKTYLEKNAEDVEIYNQLGLCQIKSADYEGALSTFDKGLSVENNSIRQSLRYNEIVAYEYMANFKKATVLMESYLNDYPDDTKAQREYDFLKTR